MNVDPSIVDKLLAFLETAPVQSALIAGVVSLIVALLTTRRDRRARRAQRAERLLQIYSPIETFLNSRSLYQYVSHNRGTLETNRQNFCDDILHLIDQALAAYVGRPMWPSGDETAKADESEKELQKIAEALIPLLRREINQLKQTVAKESG